MKFAKILAVLLAAAAGWTVPARAEQWCSQVDGHGRCLVCVWYSYPFTLRPGVPARPLVCPHMARDPNVTFKFGGAATYPGPHLHDRVGLRVTGNGRVYSHLWSSQATPVPVGPVTLPMGATSDGAYVSPTLTLTACRSAVGATAACSFVVSAKICVTGLC